MRKVINAAFLSLVVMSGCEHDRPALDPDMESESQPSTIISIRSAPKSRAKVASTVDKRDRLSISEVEMDETSATLSGQILHYQNNEPVPGAWVTVRPYGTETTSPLARTSTTDANGRFLFSGLSAGRKNISTSTPEGHPFWLAPGAPIAPLAPTLANGESTHSTIIVFSGHTVQGLVYDRETSDPLAGARITAFVDGRPLASTTSTIDGNYQLDRIPRRGSVHLDVELAEYSIAPVDRYARTNKAIVPMKFGNAITEHQDIALLRSVTLQGRVENISGAGIAGATVQWMNVQDLSRTQTTSAQDGSFVLPVTPFQSGGLTANAKGFGFNNSLPILEITNEPVSDLVIKMEAGATVNGRVTDLQGKPVKDAAILANMVHRASNDTMFHMPYKLSTTDDRGSFTGSDVSSGTVGLIIEAEDFITTRPRLKLRAGETTSVVFRLARGLSIKGKVVTSEGKPKSAYIRRKNNTGSSVKTDSDGNFTLPGLEPGRVEITIQNTDCYETTDTVAIAGDQNLMLVAGDCKFITRTGRVVDHQTKKPVEQFEISNFGTLSRVGMPAGEFEVKLSTSYVYFPVISADGYLTREFQYVNWDDKPGSVLEFEMGIGATVKGRIIDSVTRKPAGDLTVSGQGVSPSGKMPVESSATDAEGFFTISNLPYGEVEIKASARESGRVVVKKIPVTDGEVTELGELFLEPPATVETP